MKMRLFALLLAAGPASAQSLEDTASWILDQTRVNPPTLSYRIGDGLMRSEVTLGPGAAAMGAAPVRKAIPIGRVSRISFVRTQRYLSYSLACDSPCAFLEDEPDTKQPVVLLEFYAPLDAGYTARMNKALVHLVRLHGGSAVITERPAKVEPF